MIRAKSNAKTNAEQRLGIELRKWLRYESKLALITPEFVLEARNCSKAKYDLEMVQFLI